MKTTQAILAKRTEVLKDEAKNLLRGFSVESTVTFYSSKNYNGNLFFARVSDIGTSLDRLQIEKIDRLGYNILDVYVTSNKSLTLELEQKFRDSERNTALINATAWNPAKSFNHSGVVIYS